MVKKLIFSLIFTHLLHFEVSLNYCDPDVCNNTKQHTLCKYKSTEPATHCIDYERTIKTFEEKRALLNKINERKNKIACGDVRSFPAASNMLKLEWNEELEKSAQRWADQCIKQNSTSDQMDACRDLGHVPVGQNIATVYGESPGLSALSLVDVWYTELLNANSSVIYKYTKSSARGLPHYDYFTQLVWALSSEVGCGGVKFKERHNSKNRTVNRLVCNFATGGNIDEEEVYIPGPICSKCPAGSDCDLEYTALCSVKKQKTINDNNDTAIDPKSTGADIQIMSLVKKATNSDRLTDDDNITFDYISHYFDFTRQMITIPPITSSSCKEILAVDEFIELLKKKLRNDPLFKEFLMSTQSAMQNGNADITFTDPNVAVFVNKIYSKKVSTTTTRLPEQEYVNSTLLVDLVENVIFRSGEKTVPPPQLEDFRQSFVDVSPVKIQAELAEVKLNHDFTGHYFFPEDSTEVPNTETIETYDETNIVQVSDIVLEIENLKRTESTKDFLDDIIESDIGTESKAVFYTLAFDDMNVDQGTPKRRKRENLTISDNYLNNSRVSDKSEVYLRSNERNFYISYISYTDLLKKLAADLKVLKLNERFHCTYDRH